MRWENEFQLGEEEARTATTTLEESREEDGVLTLIVGRSRRASGQFPPHTPLLNRKLDAT